ncbi:hypothetical protein FACS1894202_13900 [Clostridia bacterium]|nr:hypothetical protein FACS1894202_13900 [Clostridia bacterium]
MMTVDERDRNLLKQISEEIAFIQQATTDVSADTFEHDSLLQHGIVMALQIIGECAAHLSDSFTARHAEIPWQMITGLRNRISHGYHLVDMDMVWEFVVNDIPQLNKFISTLPFRSL